MVGLLKSDVFNFAFDYDEWPSSHFDDTDVSKPYNGSIFDIRSRKTYKSLFPEIEDMNDEDNVDEKGRKRQMYKIRYTANLLPRLANHVGYRENDRGQLQKVSINPGICILYLCVNCGDLTVFETDSIKELIEFKW
jgi:hypothetical protein